MNNNDLSVFKRPGLKLEYVRQKSEGNFCNGRGKGTAAGRGYNAERLAGAVFGPYRIFSTVSPDSWYDNFSHRPSDEIYIRAEVKSCVYRYPSGRYGEFRIWKQNHDKFVKTARNWSGDRTRFIYFFVVYTVDHGLEREVGKLAVPADQVDQALDNWTLQHHSSMGDIKDRKISWHHLLKKLNVSQCQFEEEDAIDLTTNN
jgi:hypothetical protein